MTKFYKKFLFPVLTIATFIGFSTGCNHKETNENDEYDSPGQAAEFEFNRTKDPATGTVPLGKMWQAVQQTEDIKNQILYSPSSTTALTWIERGSNSDAVGPSNGNTRANGGITSGRIRAVWVDLADPTGKTAWIGGVAGGLWKTNDITVALPTWTLVNDFLSNLAVTGICQDPTDNNIMYFCTGEAYLNGGAVFGNGVFKSTDHGITWTLLPSTSTLTRGSKILCDALGNVYVSTIGISVAVGLQRSSDKGLTWTSINPFTTTSRIVDFEISSTGAMHVIGGLASAAGVGGYRFTANPATVTTASWSSATTLFPFPAGGSERVEIACLGSVVYAALGNPAAKIDAIAKSVDGGNNWTTVNLTATNITDLNGGGQAWYSQALAIDPSNANNVMVGSLNIIKSTDGGLTFSKISEWVGTTGQYVHADLHNLVWYDNGNKLIVACDGGIHYSADKGVTFRDRNTGLRLKQFYGVAIHPTLPNYFLCGAQDNGTHQFTNPGLSSSVEVTGGDGGITAIDQNEPQFQVGSYVYSNFRRSANSGANWSSGPGDNNGQFINPFDYDNITNKIYAGYTANNYLRWENPQSGFTYTIVPLTTLGGSISAVSVSAYTSNRVYFGTTVGKVVKVDNADATPTGLDITPAGMTGYVNSVNIGLSEQNLIATVSSYGVNNVWLSTNGGTSWIACDGNLPDMPVYWALFNPDDNTKAYIATETGVWSTNAFNGASTVWVPESTFPSVKTVELDYRASDRTIAAATYGRGLWTTTIPPACVPTAITTPPSNVTACATTNATFNVVANGTNVTYQWQVSTDGGATFNNIAGQTTATLTFTTSLTQNGYQYRVIVNGDCAPLSATSNAATLTVNPLPVITTQPSNSTICAGANTSFTGTATGTALTYQWQVSTDGGVTYSNVPAAAPYSGVTTTTLNITNVPGSFSGNRYRLNVNGGCASPVSSNGAILTVNTAPAITAQPQNSAVCAGSNTSFSVTATGTGLTYQWQVSTDGGATYNDIPGQTGTTLNLTAVTIGMNNNQYRVIVSGTCPSAVTSSGGILTVGSAAAITGQPSNSTVCVGANTSFTITATGSSLTYQWQLSTDGGATFNNIAGQTSATLTLTGVTASMNGYQYRVNVFSCSGSPLTSNVATLTVNTLVAITTQPTASTVCAGTNTSFTVAASGTGVSYQWQVSTTGCSGTWTNLSNTAPYSGVTTNTLSITNPAAALNGNAYRVLVNGTCNNLTSNCVLLTVNSSVVITTQPTNASLCLPGTTSFSVVATGTGITYQWQLSTDGGATFSNITGANAATYNPGTLTGSMNGYQYRVVLSGTCTAALTSNAVTLTVNLPVAITTQPSNTAVCEGSNAVISVVVTGSTITYQWQISINGGAFVNLTNAAPYSGVTTNALTITNATGNLNGTSYRVIVSGVPCGAVTSNTATLTVNQLPVPVLIVASNSSITPYIRTGLYVTVSPAGNYTYLWYKNNVLVPFRTGSYFDANVDDFGDYQVVVMNSATGCSNTTNRVTLRDSVSNTLFIVPNPSTGQFRVSYHSFTTGIVRSLNVYNASGARVYSSAYNISQYYERMEVNLKNAASGVYMVELVDSKGVRIATGRVVIKH